MTEKLDSGMDADGGGGGGGGYHYMRDYDHIIRQDASLDFTAKSKSNSDTIGICWETPQCLLNLEQQRSWMSSGISKHIIYDMLAGFMVLLGHGDAFIYSSTRQYLESEWREDGLTALRLLAAAVSRKLGGDSTLEAEESGFSFETNPGTENHIHFRLLPGMSKERRNGLESALRWLCAAVRRPGHPITVTSKPPSYHNLVWSTVAEKTNGSDNNNNNNYGLSPWSASPGSSRAPEPSCWMSLFARGAVLECPIHRDWGQGLEVSYDTMISLTGVENIYHINGGFIFLGFFTALVPIQRHEETNSIQWHLEVDNEGIDPHDLKCTSNNWFRTTDKDVLKSSRCFIGWFEKAHVMLGTSQLVADKVRTMRYTRLPEHKETVHRDGGELGAQVSFNTGIVAGTLQAVATFRYHNNEHRFEAPDQFKKALRRDSGESSLVIDAEARRAWLVPRVSWILHLCHIYYSQQCDQGDTPIPFAEPSSDGAKATISAVTDRGSTVILGEGTEHLETLSELWHRIARNLEATRRCREDPRNGKIFAVEAMDVILSRNSYPKEIQLSETSQSWAEFAKLPVTATVCAKLGHAILPVPPSGKLCECCALLEKRDLLAAHTWSLARLLEQKGSSVSRLDKEGLSFDNGTSWTVNGGLESLWTKCPAGEDCCSVWGEDPLSSPILQRPKEAGRRKDEGEESDEDPLVNVRQASESGVIVFGGRPTALEGSIAIRSFAPMTAHFERLGLFPKRKVAGS